MTVTLKDVATKVGVSISTVSRVLNDAPGISEETRALVMNVSHELGYSVNMAAHGLATAVTRNIGVIKYRRPPSKMADLGLLASEGIETALGQDGYHTLIMSVTDEMMDKRMGLEIIQQGRVDGLIFIGPAVKAQYILQFYSTGTPLVLCDNVLETPLNCVVSDNEGGTYEATRHLLTIHHHEHTVFLSGPENWSSSRERYAGYLRAVTEAGLKPHRIIMPDTTIATGQQAMYQALESIPNLTAVVGVNDATAWGAGRACKAKQLSVPDDIALVGFDDDDLALLHEPPLTTVQRYSYEMGFQTARRLLDLIEREASTNSRLQVATSLVVRRSCGCLGE